MNKKNGFTLIELLTVIGIIAMLAGLLFPTINKVKERARIARTKAMIETLSMALHAYRADWGIFGPSESELNNDGTLYDMLTTSKKNGPYIEVRSSDISASGSNNRIIDPWEGLYTVYVDTDGGNNSVPANNTHSFDISCTTPGGTSINNWE
ncbi:prepilin-type N-terminal cleavage/methylation domain-containing protein [bacterium]|nr:prepilin-type N-terminal cleavage/methylation domain-containing protein [bacterium]